VTEGDVKLLINDPCGRLQSTLPWDSLRRLTVFRVIPSVVELVAVGAVPLGGQTPALGFELFLEGTSLGLREGRRLRGVTEVDLAEIQVAYDLAELGDGGAAPSALGLAKWRGSAGVAASLTAPGEREIPLETLLAEPSRHR